MPEPEDIEPDYIHSSNTVFSETMLRRRPLKNPVYKDLRNPASLDFTGLAKLKAIN